VFDFNYLCRSEQIFISCKEYKYPMKYIFKCILKWNCLPSFCAFWRFCSQQLRLQKNERVSWSILLFYSQKAISISLMSIFPKLFVIFPTNLVNAEVIALCGLFRIRNKSAFHSFSPIVAAMKIAFIPRKTARKLAHQFNLDLFSLININRFFFLPKLKANALLYPTFALCPKKFNENFNAHLSLLLAILLVHFKIIFDLYMV